MDNDSLYFFLSSKDSLEYHPANNAFNFTTELCETVDLNGKEWELALCDFFSSNLVNEVLYIYCDLTDYNYISGTKANIIRPLILILIIGYTLNRITICL